MAVTGSDKLYAVFLKQLRKKHQLIQYTLAQHLGFESQQQYSDLENGKKHFSDELIIRICTLFNISVLDFIKASDRENSLYFLNSIEYREINEMQNSDLKMTLYKKLFLESKIENVEHKIKALQNECRETVAVQGKHKIYVIV